MLVLHQGPGARYGTVSSSPWHAGASYVVLLLGSAACGSGARLQPLFPSSPQPTLFKAAGTLVPGMPIAEARTTAPDLFAHDPLRPKGFDDVVMSAKADAYDHLAGVTMQLGCKTALADVMALWGAPATGYDTRAKAKLYWWFNPATHLRATLETPDAADTCRVVFDRYLPLLELIGTTDDRLGIEHDPLLGAAEADVTRTYHDFLPDPASRLCNDKLLILPPVEFDRTFTRVRVGCSKGTVAGLDIVMNYSAHVEMKETILDLLKKKLGEPKNVTQEMLAYPQGKLTVTIKNQPQMSDVDIEVRRGPQATPAP